MCTSRKRGYHVCACVEKFSSACLCLRVWNVTDVTVTTMFYALTKGWRRWGRLKCRLFGLQIRPKKKKDFAYSYKKVPVEKNPHGVQRDLCLSDKNNSYSLRNPLGVREEVVQLDGIRHWSQHAFVSFSLCLQLVFKENHCVKHKLKWIDLWINIVMKSSFLFEQDNQWLLKSRSRCLAAALPSSPACGPGLLCLLQGCAHAPNDVTTASWPHLGAQLQEKVLNEGKAEAGKT